MTRSLAPLRCRSFRFLMAGQFASNLGDACYVVALPWYVLAEHGGPLLRGRFVGPGGLAGPLDAPGLALRTLLRGTGEPGPA